MNANSGPYLCLMLSPLPSPRTEASYAGPSFKNASRCDWDHPVPRVSPNVAQAAPCRARWDRIFPCVGVGGDSVLLGV